MPSRPGTLREKWSLNTHPKRPVRLHGAQLYWSDVGTLRGVDMATGREVVRIAAETTPTELAWLEDGPVLGYAHALAGGRRGSDVVLTPGDVVLRGGKVDVQRGVVVSYSWTGVERWRKEIQGTVQALAALGDALFVSITAYADNGPRAALLVLSARDGAELERREVEHAISPLVSVGQRVFFNLRSGISSVEQGGALATIFGLADAALESAGNHLLAWATDDVQWIFDSNGTPCFSTPTARGELVVADQSLIMGEMVSGVVSIVSRSIASGTIEWSMPIPAAPGFRPEVVGTRDRLAWNESHESVVLVERDTRRILGRLASKSAPVALTPSHLFVIRVGPQLVCLEID